MLKFLSYIGPWRARRNILLLPQTLPQVRAAAKRFDALSPQFKHLPGERCCSKPHHGLEQLWNLPWHLGMPGLLALSPCFLCSWLVANLLFLELYPKGKLRSGTIRLENTQVGRCRNSTCAKPFRLKTRGGWLKKTRVII